MGITGCGKTSFINMFSDRELLVGHDLDSCTLCLNIIIHYKLNVIVQVHKVWRSYPVASERAK
jgi:hypothetical protein